MKDELELEELNLEDEDEDCGEEEWEDTASLKPGTVILLFVALILLAAMCCGILWKVTHAQKTEGQVTVQEASGAEQSDEVSSAEQSEETSAEQDVGASAAEQNAETSAEQSEEGAAEQDAEVSSAEQNAETSAEQHTEVSSAEQNAAGGSTETTASTNPNRVPTLDGRVIVFTDCDDVVSPKIYVNLRLEPSTSEGNATVHCRLNYGETVRRTGISEDSGWSRVEKDGVVCYVVSSLIYVVEQQ